MIIIIISWIAVVGVLASYAASTRMEPARGVRFYALANLTLAVPVALPALLASAYSSAAISLAFGVLGGWTLLSRRKRARYTPPQHEDGMVKPLWFTNGEVIIDGKPVIIPEVDRSKGGTFVAPYCAHRTDIFGERPGWAPGDDALYDEWKASGERSFFWWLVMKPHAVAYAPEQGEDEDDDSSWATLA